MEEVIKITAPQSDGSKVVMMVMEPDQYKFLDFEHQGADHSDENEDTTALVTFAYETLNGETSITVNGRPISRTMVRILMAFLEQNL